MRRRFPTVLEAENLCSWGQVRSVLPLWILSRLAERLQSQDVGGWFLIQNSHSQALHATLFHERTSSNALMADYLSLTCVVPLANNLCPDSQMLGIVNGDPHTADIDCLIHKSSALKCVYSNVMDVGDFCHLHRQ